MTNDTLPKPVSMLERELSQETMSAIKAIVLEDRADSGRAEPPAATLRDPQATAAPSKPEIPQTKKRAGKARKKALAGIHINMSSDQPSLDARQVDGSVKPKLDWAKIRKEITPRRLSVLVMFITFLIRPWFLPTVLLLVLLLAVFVALLLGPDRIKHYSEVLWKGFERRRPEKAAELRLKAMRRLNRMQKRLDKLPARWTQGLYLPQMQSDAEQSAAETAYAKRMARMAQDQRQQRYS